MPKFTNTRTGVTVDIGDNDRLPPPEQDWEEGGGSPKRKRRADTGTLPVQHNN